MVLQFVDVVNYIDWFMSTKSHIFAKKKNNLVIWLCWVFVAAWAFLWLRSAGAALQLQCEAPRCGGFARWVARLQGTRAVVAERVGSAVAAAGLQSTGSVVVVHGLSCFVACGIFPNQESNPCLLHWQEDSLPLSHQGSPVYFLSEL